MITKTKIIIILTVALVLLLGVIAIISLRKPPAVVIESASSDNNSSSLSLGNLSQYPDGDDTEWMTKIKQGLLFYIEDRGEATSMKTSGAIRQGSYSSHQDADKIKEEAFIVDLASLRQSYKVTVTFNPALGFRVFDISCPSSKEVIYDDFDCAEKVEEHTHEE